ncbi:VanZ family protein [Bacteroidota bacterium]
MEFILKNKKLFAIFFWLWVAIIIYFTLTPSSPQLKVDLNEKSFRLDYIMHFLVYFSLAILYLLWKADNYLNVKSKYIVYFLISSLVLSGISEYLQTYIPGRTFNPIDFYSNSAGIIFGIIVPKLVLK